LKSKSTTNGPSAHKFHHIDPIFRKFFPLENHFSFHFIG
jgi:hypothetical protein